MCKYLHCVLTFPFLIMSRRWCASFIWIHWIRLKYRGWRVVLCFRIILAGCQWDRHRHRRCSLSSPHGRSKVQPTIVMDRIYIRYIGLSKWRTDFRKRKARALGGFPLRHDGSKNKETQKDSSSERNEHWFLISLSLTNEWGFKRSNLKSQVWV